MNYQLQYLATLVLEKNALNRRRRRFYSYINGRNNSYCLSRKSKTRKLPIQYYKDMYKTYQDEMKAMTPAMREARKLAGVSIVWGDSGNIRALRIRKDDYHGETLYLDEVERLAELYHADKILLGE